MKKCIVVIMAIVLSLSNLYSQATKKEKVTEIKKEQLKAKNEYLRLKAQYLESQKDSSGVYPVKYGPIMYGYIGYTSNGTYQDIGRFVDYSDGSRKWERMGP